MFLKSRCTERRGCMYKQNQAVKNDYENKELIALINNNNNNNNPQKFEKGIR